MYCCYALQVCTGVLLLCTTGVYRCIVVMHYKCVQVYCFYALQVYVRCPLQYGVLDGLMSLLSLTLAQVHLISVAGLLLWARQAGDIDQLLHGRRSCSRCKQCYLIKPQILCKQPASFSFSLL